MLKTIVLAVAFALASCSTAPPGTTGTTTPAQSVFAVKSAYAGALSVAVAYKRLPACAPSAPLLCSSPAIVSQLQKADNTAAAAIDAAEAAARTPIVGTTAAGKALSAAQAALAALVALTSNLKVTQ